MNIKLFSQISRTNETRYVSCHKTCKCKCRCECKELTNKRICDEGFIWNPSKCECECDRSCVFGQYYIYYESCKCRKKIIDKLVEDCKENIDEILMIVLLVIFSMISIGISCAFIFFTST